MSTLNVPSDEAEKVLDYWFNSLSPEQWWKRDDALDAEISLRFRGLYDALTANIPDAWLTSPRRRLAAVIVLDQFPRNMFRDDARAHVTDNKALELASETIERGWDVKLDPLLRSFLYMPFQHSEDLAVQERSVALFHALGNADNLDFANKHKEIIERFGRFPHRNRVLGRKSAPEEIEFLKEPGLFW